MLNFGFSINFRIFIPYPLVLIKQMNKFKIILLFTIPFLSCKSETKNTKMQFLEKEVPNNMPIEFKENLIPQNKIIHKGIFSLDLKEYYIG